MNKKSYLVILILLYGFFIYHFSILNNAKILEIFNWFIFSKLFLLIFPLVIFYIGISWDNIKKYDLYAVFIPFVFWFIFLCCGLGKSFRTVLVVQFPLVCLTSCIYAFRDKIVKINILKKYSENKICLGLIVFEIGIIFFMMVLSPRLSS